jgi:DNA-binding transcriptional regulator GbsR (MarR family)
MVARSNLFKQMTSLLKKEDGMEVLSLIQRIMIRLGYNETDGKIYGVLLLSPAPLSIDDICKVTGLSRTTVSTSLSKLVKDYLVNRSKRGRTKLHTATPIFTEKFVRQPQEILNKEIKPLSTLLTNIYKNGGDGFGHLKGFIKDLRETESFLIKLIKEGKPL